MREHADNAAATWRTEALLQSCNTLKLPAPEKWQTAKIKSTIETYLNSRFRDRCFDCNGGVGAVNRYTFKACEDWCQGLTLMIIARAT